MVEVLTSLGDRLTKSEARKLVANADVTGDGRIDYKGMYRIIMKNKILKILKTAPVVCIFEWLLGLLVQQKSSCCVAFSIKL